MALTFPIRAARSAPERMKTACHKASSGRALQPTSFRQWAATSVRRPSGNPSKYTIKVYRFSHAGSIR
jgi:hypothetical protein